MSPLLTTTMAIMTTGIAWSADLRTRTRMIRHKTPLTRNYTITLPAQDSNLEQMNQSHPCCQLHQQAFLLLALTSTTAQRTNLFLPLSIFQHIKVTRSGTTRASIRHSSPSVVGKDGTRTRLDQFHKLVPRPLRHPSGSHDWIRTSNRRLNRPLLCP